MIIRGIEEEHDLQAALEVVNYAYRGNLRFRNGPATVSSYSWRLRLGVEDLAGPGRRLRVPISWWDRSWWDRQARHTYSACYHAHRDFLYAVFERVSYARVTTSFAHYEGLRNFESTHWRVGKLNAGSFFEPTPFEECCNCAERFPWIEQMKPEAYLGEEYSLEPDRKIYSGLEQRSKS
jgi:hypothetical protein